MLTDKYLRYWHTRFNRLVFDGKLGKCPVLALTLPDNIWGRCWGTSIEVSAEADLARARRTLLHEMVHQWQFENHLPMTHGRSFNQWEDRCLKLTGFSL